MSARAGHRRRRPRFRFGRAGVALSLCLAGLVLATAFLGITVQANALAREKAALQAEIVSTAAQRAALQDRIAQQRTDDYVTRAARNLGLIGQNETLFAVQRDNQASGPSARVPAGHSRLARWVAFFFGSR